MNEEELYLFDLNGYLVVEQVLTAAEVDEANAAIDHHADSPSTYASATCPCRANRRPSRERRAAAISAACWAGRNPGATCSASCCPTPASSPVLNQIVGPGFRMDHSPGLITMRKGAEGCTLHGSSGPHFDPNQYYVYRDGQMHNGLTVVAWQLSDVEEGDGGLCLIPGSHKANFACPRPIKLWHRRREIVRAITCRAGDAVIFTEAVTHGTLPWRSERERRSLLYRYSPANLAYATGYMPWPEQMLEGMTAEQRAILEPPYHRRLNRPELDDEGRLRETAG